MNKKGVITVVLISAFLLICITGCVAQKEKNVATEKINKFNTQSLSATIDIPEGFVEGEPVTSNTLVELYKGTAGINLSRAYTGNNDSLNEYVRDSKEKFEDDTLSFMEFKFVDTDGLKYEGKEKQAIAFEALQGNYVKKFWVVYIPGDNYVFEITCYSEKDEFDSLSDKFNEAIKSFKIIK